MRNRFHLVDVTPVLTPIISVLTKKEGCRRMELERSRMFLTFDELVELTDRKQVARQIEWLATNGFKFELSAAGRPKVLVAEVEARLLSRPRQRRQEEPDFSWMESK
jgi:hypothetical protein